MDKFQLELRIAELPFNVSEDTRSVIHLYNSGHCSILVADKLLSEKVSSQFQQQELKNVLCWAHNNKE